MNHTGLFALLSYIGSESHGLTQSFLMNVTEEAKLWSKLEDWWVQRRGDCGALLAILNHEEPKAGRNTKKKRLRSNACKWMKQANCFINVHEHYCQKSTFV